MGGELKGLQLLFCWLLQIGLFTLFIFTGGMKLISTPETVALFTQLGMEPGGRVIIGLLEAGGAVMMLIPNTANTGAFLLLGVMCGAAIAHLSVIGMVSPLMIIMLVGALIACLFVLYFRGLPKIFYAS